MASFLMWITLSLLEGIGHMLIWGSRVMWIFLKTMGYLVFIAFCIVGAGIASALMLFVYLIAIIIAAIFHTAAPVIKKSKYRIYYPSWK